jgi:hypothetical protein
VACSVSEPRAPVASLKPSDRWTGWIVAVLATVFFATVCRPVLPYARQHDFLSFYTGARLVAEGRAVQLYDPAVQSDRERILVPGLIYIAPYIRPPIYAAVLAPLAALPLPVGFATWIAAQVVVLLCVWWWAYVRFGNDALVFCSLFLPAAYGIAHGQDCVFLLAVLLSAWVALEHGHGTLAGAIAALVLMKFHLVMLLVPVMILCGKWRILTGFGLAALAEIGLSLAMVGVAGAHQYMGLLTAKDLETLSPSPERMINLQALLVNAGLDVWWMRVLSIAAVILFTCWAAWRLRRGTHWFWIAILGSILVAPHAYQYDAALLLPALLISIFEPGASAKLRRMAAATAALPVVYLGTLVGPPWAGAASLALTVWFVLLGWRGVTQ